MKDEKYQVQKSQQLKKLQQMQKDKKYRLLKNLLYKTQYRNQKGQEQFIAYSIIQKISNTGWFNNQRLLVLDSKQKILFYLSKIPDCIFTDNLGQIKQLYQNNLVKQKCLLNTNLQKQLKKNELNTDNNKILTIQWDKIKANKQKQQKLWQFQMTSNQLAKDWQKLIQIIDNGKTLINTTVKKQTMNIQQYKNLTPPPNKAPNLSTPKSITQNSQLQMKSQNAFNKKLNDSQNLQNYTPNNSNTKSPQKYFRKKFLLQQIQELQQSAGKIYSRKEMLEKSLSNKKNKNVNNNSNEKTQIKFDDDIQRQKLQKQKNNKRFKIIQGKIIRQLNQQLNQYQNNIIQDQRNNYYGSQQEQDYEFFNNKRKNYNKSRSISKSPNKSPIRQYQGLDSSTLSRQDDQFRGKIVNVKKYINQSKIIQEKLDEQTQSRNLLSQSLRYLKSSKEGGFHQIQEQFRKTMAKQKIFLEIDYRNSKPAGFYDYNYEKKIIHSRYGSWKWNQRWFRLLIGWYQRKFERQQKLKRSNRLIKTNFQNKTQTIQDIEIELSYILKNFHYTCQRGIPFCLKYILNINFQTKQKLQFVKEYMNVLSSTKIYQFSFEQINIKICMPLSPQHQTSEFNQTHLRYIKGIQTSFQKDIQQLMHLNMSQYFFCQENNKMVYHIFSPMIATFQFLGIKIFCKVLLDKSKYIQINLNNDKIGNTHNPMSTMANYLQERLSQTIKNKQLYQNIKTIYISNQLRKYNYMVVQNAYNLPTNILSPSSFNEKQFQIYQFSTQQIFYHALIKLEINFQNECNINTTTSHDFLNSLNVFSDKNKLFQDQNLFKFKKIISTIDGMFQFVYFLQNQIYDKSQKEQSQGVMDTLKQMTKGSNNQNKNKRTNIPFQSQHFEYHKFDRYFLKNLNAIIQNQILGNIIYDQIKKIIIHFLTILQIQIKLHQINARDKYHINNHRYNQNVHLARQDIQRIQRKDMEIKIQIQSQFIGKITIQIANYKIVTFTEIINVILQSILSPILQSIFQKLTFGKNRGKKILRFDEYFKLIIYQNLLNYQNIQNQGLKIKIQNHKTKKKSPIKLKQKKKNIQHQQNQLEYEENILNSQIFSQFDINKMDIKYVYQLILNKLMIKENKTLSNMKAQEENFNVKLNKNAQPDNNKEYLFKNSNSQNGTGIVLIQSCYRFKDDMLNYQLMEENNQSNNNFTTNTYSNPNKYTKQLNKSIIQLKLQQMNNLIRKSMFNQAIQIYVGLMKNQYDLDFKNSCIYHPYSSIQAISNQSVSFSFLSLIYPIKYQQIPQYPLYKNSLQFKQYLQLVMKYNNLSQRPIQKVYGKLHKINLMHNLISALINYKMEKQQQTRQLLLECQRIINVKIMKGNTKINYQQNLSFFIFSLPIIYIIGEYQLYFNQFQSCLDIIGRMLKLIKSLYQFYNKAAQNKILNSQKLNFFIDYKNFLLKGKQITYNLQYNKNQYFIDQNIKKMMQIQFLLGHSQFRQLFLENQDQNQMNYNYNSLYSHSRKYDSFGKYIQPQLQKYMYLSYQLLVRCHQSNNKQNGQFQNYRKIKYDCINNMRFIRQHNLVFVKLLKLILKIQIKFWNQQKKWLVKRAIQKLIQLMIVNKDTWRYQKFKPIDILNPSRSKSRIIVTQSPTKTKNISQTNVNYSPIKSQAQPINQFHSFTILIYSKLLSKPERYFDSLCDLFQDKQQCSQLNKYFNKDQNKILYLQKQHRQIIKQSIYLIKFIQIIGPQYALNIFEKKQIKKFRLSKSNKKLINSNTKISPTKKGSKVENVNQSQKKLPFDLFIENNNINNPNKYSNNYNSTPKSNNNRGKYENIVFQNLTINKITN